MTLVMKLGTRRTLAASLLLVMLSLSSGEIRAQQAEAAPATRQFQQLEDKWSAALANKDQYALELLLAPTFVDISAAGSISTRNQLISGMFDHASGDLLSIEQRAVNVRVLGDLSIVDGTYILHYRAGTHAIDERGVFTHVYQQARASWVCIHAQRTAVFDQAEDKQKQPGKKSNTAVPFHIPLLYKGAAPAAPSTADKQPPQ